MNYGFLNLIGYQLNLHLFFSVMTSRTIVKFASKHLETGSTIGLQSMSHLLSQYLGMNLDLLHQAGVLYQDHQVHVQLVIHPQNLTL